MKRSPIPRREQRLKTDPEKQRQWERRSRKRLPARSAKRVDEDRARRKLKVQLLVAAGLTADGQGPLERACAGRLLVPEIACSSPARSRPRLEMHEVVKRSRWRKGIALRENCVLLCQAHHDYTERFPYRARDVGLLASAPHVHPFDKFEDG